MFFSPLEQFEIIYVGFDVFFLKIVLFVKNLLGSDIFNDYSEFEKYINNYFLYNDYLLTDIHLSNFFFFSRFGVYFVLLLFIFGTFNHTIYPSNVYSYIVEKIFVLLKNIVSQNFENKFYGQFYFPFIFTIFFYILVLNLLGLIPFGFTVTSFCVQTFTLSCSMLIGLTILSICIQGKEFFAHFVPTGIPVVLIPMLVLIEIISYVSRAFSLAIRLFANLMSGHTLLNILSSFVLLLSKYVIFIGLIPFIIVLAISFLEVGIALLQAYVFMILLTLYFNDTCKVYHFNDSKTFVLAFDYPYNESERLDQLFLLKDSYGLENEEFEDYQYEFKYI